MKPGFNKPNHNIAHLVQQRQLKDSLSRNIQQKLHVIKEFVFRLGLEKELEGHNGCVNCLEWNDNGQILASASDDCQVILWDPFYYHKIHTINTGHNGNIFSVKFLPKSNDNIVITGAGDYRIRVHDVLLEDVTTVCNCHTGRVKRLATAPNVPFMFWSAAEDGTVLQFDLRMQHACSRNVNNVLINLLTHLGRYAEAKCLAVNPQRPELLAVGVNDPYIRVYDRRMIKPTTIEYPPENVLRSSWERQSYMARCAGEGQLEDNLPHGCVQYYVAGHLPVKQQDYRKKYRSLAATYVTFSADGTELLVNLGGEQIYLFDINNNRKPKKFDLPTINVDVLKSCSEHCSTSNGYSNGFRNGTNGYAAPSNGVTFNAHEVTSLFTSHPPSPPPVPASSKKSIVSKVSLPYHIEALKITANDAFEKQHYTLAISLYNEAISIHPAAVLHGNRAAALMKRGWDGDIYAAMRDCHIALQLDPGHVKAHFRLARCLFELQWIKEAAECLQSFRHRFPDHVHSHACKALLKDIESSMLALDREVESEEGDSSGNSSSEKPSMKASGNFSASAQEHIWREQAYDYEVRFCGHCNTTTDIKEANFFGSMGQYIVAGSDDGSFFIWDRHTTNIVRVLRGDDSIVNCLQPHPSYCLLATSGIDPVVRLWSPRPEDGTANDRVVLDLDDAASANQKRMNADPFEVMLMNIGYRITSVQGDEGETINFDDPSRDPPAINCRTS